MLRQTVLSSVLLSGVIGRCQSRGVQVGNAAPLTQYCECDPCHSVGFWGISFSPQLPPVFASHLAVPVGSGPGFPLGA